MSEFMKVSPESMGVDTNAILGFARYMRDGRYGMHSFAVLRGGKLLYEGSFAPYTADTPHMMFSCSKVFTSAAVGICIGDGLLHLDDRILDIFSDYSPKNMSENKKKMTLRHLLIMNTGHHDDTTGRIRGTDDWVGAFLDLPVEHEPGTHFVYNSGASYMLSAAVTKVTGKSAHDLLKERVFGRLGMGETAWSSCTKGISCGGWGMVLTLRQMAKMGQLFLQKGVWEDEQLIPAEWMEEMPRVQYEKSYGFYGMEDWIQGYGYHCWRNSFGGWRGDGAMGQYIIVLPEKDMVIVETGGTNDMYGFFDAVGKKLLPGVTDGALPENPAAIEALDAYLAAAVNDNQGRLPAHAAGPHVAMWTGRDIMFAEKDAPVKGARFDLDGGVLSVKLIFDGFDAEYSMPADGAWVRYEAPAPWIDRASIYNHPHMDKQPFASRAAFSGDKLDMELWGLAYPMSRKVTVMFTADGMAISGLADGKPLTAKA